MQEEKKKKKKKGLGLMLERGVGNVGVSVQSVVRGSVAAVVGVFVGDLIEAVNGEEAIELSVCVVVLVILFVLVCV